MTRSGYRITEQTHFYVKHWWVALPQTELLPSNGKRKHIKLLERGIYIPQDPKYIHQSVPRGFANFKKFYQKYHSDISIDILIQLYYVY